MEVLRGDIIYCYLHENTSQGSVQKGRRPVVIVQNDVGNKHSPTTIVSPITSKGRRKRGLPTHVPISSRDIHNLTENFNNDSIILFEQIITVDKRNLKEKVGSIDLDKKRYKKALAISIALE